MKQLLLRAFLVFLSATALVALTLAIMVEAAHERQFAGSQGRALAGTAALFRDWLVRRPDASLSAIAPAFSYPVELISIERARALSPAFAGRAVVPVSDGVIVLESIPERGAVLQLGPVPDDTGPDARALGLGVSAILLIALAAGLIVILPIVRRVTRLEAAALAIQRGELSARVGLRSDDAIGRLAKHFDDMADRVQRNLESQRALLQTVSHELKTPIARMRFSLEALDGPVVSPAHGKHIAILDRELDELDNLLAELIAYARIDFQDHTSGGEPFDAIAAAHELVDRVAATTPRVRLRMARGVERCELPVDRTKFERALGNLLVNAARYAEQEVEVRSRVQGDELVIEVVDDGPGVAPDQRERIFLPFVRDPERSTGTGLGLTIVRRVLDQAGGRVEVSEAPNGGARFTTFWPRSTPPPK